MTEQSPIRLVERAAARLRQQSAMSSSVAALTGLDHAGLDHAGEADALPDTAIDTPAGAVPGAAPGASAVASLARESLARESLAREMPDAAASVRPAEAPGSILPGPMFLDRAALERGGLLPVTTRRSRVGEEMRIAAGNVLRALRGPELAANGARRAQPQQGNLVLITSCRAGEGKSFTALNLAATLAEQGVARVLLVDVDPKANALGTLLGLRGQPGLEELGHDPALKPERFAARTAIRDLTVLPRGCRDDGAHGVTRAMAAALDRVSRSQAGQVVMLDAPPCLATSEAAMLAPMAALVVLVVEAERTQRDAVARAVELLKPCANILLLLNKLRGVPSDDFGGYDYYGV